MTTHLPFLIPLPVALDDTQRISSESETILSRLLDNLIYSSTVPLPFEDYTEGVNFLLIYS